MICRRPPVPSRKPREKGAASVRGTARPAAGVIRDRTLAPAVVSGPALKADLNRFDDGAVVGIDELIESGLVKKVYNGIKILGNGELTKKITVKAAAFSESAKEKIEAKGGNVEVI